MIAAVRGGMAWYASFRFAICLSLDHRMDEVGQDRFKQGEFVRQEGIVRRRRLEPDRDAC